MGQENSKKWLSKPSQTLLHASLEGESINLLCSREKRKSGLVSESYLLPLICQPALISSTPIQIFLNILIKKQKFPDRGFFMISDLIELKVNILGWNGANQMLLMLARLIHAGGLILLLKSSQGLLYCDSQKPIEFSCSGDRSFCIWTPTICPFLNSLRLHLKKRQK